MTTRSIMFVDDDPHVLAALARLFRLDPDLLVFVAHDAFDALRKLEQNPMDLIVTDFRMPIMDGVDLLDEVAKLYPQTRGAILSAHAEVKTLLRSRQGKPLPPFFSKPWDNDSLHQSVRRLLRLPPIAPKQETPALAAA